MTQAVRRWMPLLGLLALLASAPPASAQITLPTVASLANPGGPNSVAFDSVNQVYLVVSYGPPVMGQFLDKNGTSVGSVFNITLETPIGGSDPFTAWPSIAFGGPADDPVFLVTYGISGGSNPKFGRLVRYRAGGEALVSDRSYIADLTTEWIASEKGQNIWDGEQFIVGTRVPSAPFPVPQLNHFDVHGTVSPPQILGDYLDYEGSPAIACTGTGVCIATGYAAGIPWGYKGGSWFRLFDANTLAPLSSLLYLDDHTSRQEDQGVIYNPRSSQFLTAWWQAGYINMRLVEQSGVLGPVPDASHKFGPGAGDNRIVFNNATATSLLLTKYDPLRTGEADLWVAELGEDGAPRDLNNAFRIAVWDTLVSSYTPALTADPVNGRWMGTFRLAAGGRGALVQGTLAAPPVPPAPPPDFNGDRMADLVWSNASSGAITVSYIDGSSVVGTGSLGSVPAGWQLVAVGDLNGDGKSDLVFRNSTTGVATVWFMDRTTATGWGYLDTQSDTAWQIAAAADMNNDSKVDLIWRNSVTGANEIWYMNGATRTARASIDTLDNVTWQIVGAGDFSGDRKPDLLWRNAVSGANMVWYMTGATHTGTASLEPIADANIQVAMVADFNADGKPDIVWRNYSNGDNMLWVMNGVTHLSTLPMQPVADTNEMAIRRVNTRPVNPTSSDLNADGLSDLVWRNYLTGANTVWFMNHGAMVSSGALETVNTAFYIAALADFNRDGNADIVWRNAMTGTTTVWYMSGTTRLTWAYIDVTVDARMVDPSMMLVGAADFNADGRPDLLWRNRFTDQTIIWYMDGPTGVARTGSATLPATGDTNLEVAGVADFNGDGKPDIVWRSRATGQTTVWYMNGATHTSTASLGTVPPDWDLVAIGDSTGDGKVDLVWRNASTGTTTMWYMDGTTVTGWYVLSGMTGTTWTIGRKGSVVVPGPQALDLNGDGKADLLWRYNTGMNTAWFMNGGTVGSWGYVEAVTPDWYIASVVDMNQDGKADIVWRNSASGTNAVWYMNGITRTSWSYIDAVADTNMQLVGAGDLNNDGKADLVWRNTSTGENTVWYMDGTTHVASGTLDTVSDSNMFIVGVADLNADGKPDLVWWNKNTGTATVWYMDGTSHRGSATLASIPPTWQLSAVADFDGDGKPDVIWRNYTTGANTIWFLDGVTVTSWTYLDTLSDVNWAILRKR